MFDQFLKRGRRAALAALLIALGLGGAHAAQAADVVLRVDGLACPFCAFGIEKKLLAVPAVEGIDVRMNEGRVILRLREGERLDLAALDAAVEDAGFTLRKILIEDAVGTLSKGGAGELVLRCSAPPATFRLHLAGEDAAPGAEAGSTVAVSGTVEEYGADPAPLVVTSLRPVAPGSGEETP